MKKLATAAIATAGIATFMAHDADAAENNQGYNPNDPYSYSYNYTIDQEGNYNYTWEGNWNPSSRYGNQAQQQVANTTPSNNTASSNNEAASNTNYSQPAFNAAPNGGGSGESSNASSNQNNVRVTTTQAPTSSNQATTSNSSSNVSTTTTSTSRPSTGGGANLYTSGQCTYYAFSKRPDLGSTWGNANNWASAAAQSGYTVNNNPSSGAVLQSTAGGYGHVAYVDKVNSDGSIQVSEMNYQGVGVVSTRTISASAAGSYNYIH